MLDLEADVMVERKTKDPLVKSSAKEMVTASSKADKDLISIARGKGINRSAVQSEENLTQITALKTLWGNY
jgi:predicted outer membrane protein